MNFVKTLFNNLMNRLDEVKDFLWMFVSLTALFLIADYFMPRKEGICVFGCGSKSKTKVTINNTVINEFVRDISVKQMTEHGAAISADQIISIKDVKGDVIVKDVKMKIVAETALQSVSKKMKSDEVKKRMKTMLTQAVSVENAAESGFGSVLSGGAKAETDLEATNEVINKSMTKLTDEQIDKCFASVSTSQALEIEGVGGSVLIDHFDMETTAKATANCFTEQIIKNIEDVGAETKLDQDITTKTSAKVGGLEDLLDSIFGGLTGWIRYLIIGIVIIGVVSVIGGVIWLVMSGTKPQDLAEAAQSMKGPGGFGGPGGLGGGGPGGKPVGLPKLPSKPGIRRGDL